MTSPEQPERGTGSPQRETVLGETTVTVRRSPRIVNFIILGAVLGALVAVVLTYGMAGNPKYGRTQVLGFLLVGCVAAGVALGSVVALVLGRIVGRSGRSVIADRVGIQSADAGASGAATPPAAAPLTDAAPASPTSGTTPSEGIPPVDPPPSGAASPETKPSNTTSEKSE